MTGHISWLIVMDVFVMGFCVAMIVFALRLSKQLDVFRRSRDDLRVLVRDMADSVIRAEQAIAGMKENARLTGRELQGKIDHARTISDELQFLSEASSNKEARAERRTRRRPDAPEKPGGFAIRDPDVDAPPETGQFQSRAERELFEAMRKRGKGQP